MKPKNPMKTPNPMKTAKLLSALALLGGLSCHGAVIVNDTFADGNRTTQNPPSSLAWFSGRASDTLIADTGSMTLTPTVNSNFALAYFTPGGSPISLSVGETLTLSVSFEGTLTGNTSATGVRFGIFNSGGSRISADNQGTDNAVYANYTGYAGVFGRNNSLNTEVSSNTWERTNLPSNALIGTASVWTVPTPLVTDNSLASATTYTLMMTVDYISLTNMTVTSTLSGGDLSGVTTTYVDASPVANFDTLALWAGANPFTEIAFSSVNLTVVPEPAVGALFGLGLVFLALRRRKSA